MAMHKVTLQRSCGWFPPRVYEVCMEIVEDEILTWSAYDGEGRIECGQISWLPDDATQSFAHELVALHRFDAINARLIAEDLYHRLHIGPGQSLPN